MTKSRELPDPIAVPTVNVAQAARLLGISRSKAYEAIQTGEIPCLRFGQRIVVPTVAIWRMLGLEVP